MENGMLLLQEGEEEDVLTDSERKEMKNLE